jgi:hypothetical protein
MSRSLIADSESSPFQDVAADHLSRQRKTLPEGLAIELLDSIVPASRAGGKKLPPGVARQFAEVLLQTRHESTNASTNVVGRHVFARWSGYLGLALAVLNQPLQRSP